MSMPPLLLRGMREIDIQASLTSLLEDLAAAARLSTILTSQVLHDAWRECDDVASGDDVVLGGIGRLFGTGCGTSTAR